MRTPKEIRDRIGELYPGDGNKALRHSLYSEPNFLKSDPSDEEIQGLASRLVSGWGMGDEGTQANPIVASGDILDPDTRADLIQAEAEIYATSQPQVIVTTAAEYEQASLGFAAVKKMLADNEKTRKELKEPILESGRRLDAKFKSAEKILLDQLSRFEIPMLEFKRKEREGLRKAEADRQAAVDAERSRLQAMADTKLAELEAVKQRVANNRLSALLDDDYGDTPANPVLEALESAKNAVREVATVDRAIPALAAAPVTAIGSKASYPWIAEITNGALVPREYCSPDPAKLSALAKRLKADLRDDITKVDPNVCPGVRIYEDIRISGR